MPKIVTPINGITTTSVYNEGDCFSLVNLRPKNGALHPVAPRKVLQQLSQKYDIVFLHQNNDYKNWIGVVNHEDNTASVYWNILSDNPILIQNGIVGKIHSVEQIGNTLSLVTSNNIYYLLFQNDEYIFMGELPQIPNINISTQYVDHNLSWVFPIGSVIGSQITKETFTESLKGYINWYMNMLVNGYTSSSGEFNPGFGAMFFDGLIIRWAFRLYDDSLTKHSPPILVMPEKDIFDTKFMYYYFNGDTLNPNSYGRANGFRMKWFYDFSGFEKWKDIIKSVDIFISKPVGVSNIENIRDDLPTTMDDFITEQLINQITAQNIKDIEDTSTFYLVRSIDLETVVEEETPQIFPEHESKDDINLINNLLYQEVMSDDNFSNHKYGANHSYTYNNRLHIADITTTFFKGFNAGYFQWNGKYNGVDKPDGDIKEVFAEVEIQVGSRLEKVYASYSDDLFKKLFLSSFISYPDPRAKRITFYEVIGSSWTRVFTAQLKPHDFLNLAYYLNESLKPIISTNLGPVTVPDTSKVIVLSESNKLKVSDLNNPLLFPNINTYQISNGSILALASNAMRISEGQFGQFPLYVFTTQGVYSLNVGDGNTVYSNESAPTSFEIPISSIVTSTPFGVIFISARGVCIIRGQEVSLLTYAIQDPVSKLNIEFLPPMVNVIHNFDHPVLKEYLQNINLLVYNPHENEIIIYSNKYGFNYVLNMDSESFYQSTEKVEQVVGNTFPDLYVISGSILKDFSYTDTDSEGVPVRADVSFILRPLNYGSQYIKWLEKILMFCTMYDVNPLLYVTHSSMNGVNFKAMSGMNPSMRGNYTTIETPRIAGNKFTDFLFSFGATLSEESRITHIESLVTPQYKENILK